MMSDRDRPTVSIVTPAYNAARYLEDLLRSVEAQDYPGIEHIVIDDGSNDGGATLRILERHPKVRWWSRDNRGQYATMNEGFRAATGDFVTAISADDTYVDAGAISALAGVLIDHPDYDVAYGYTLHLNEDATPVMVQPYQRHPIWMLRYNLGFIFHCSLLVRRDRLIRDGLLFDESFRFIGDADWMLRLYRQPYRFRRIERYVGAYRHHGHQVSTAASGDAPANARRRDEHERVHRHDGTSRLVKRLVEAYDTLQQRRVKAIGAWRHGGGRQLWNLASAWVRRKYDRE
jgi:glycosyltransferase involved in cell wall biosynthesis